MRSEAGSRAAAPSGQVCANDAYIFTFTISSLKSSLKSTVPSNSRRWIYVTKMVFLTSKIDVMLHVLAVEDVHTIRVD